MEKIATDTYSFADIRKGGFVYVDKTAILKILADGSLGKQFFVARPRRFGKSLAVSTLQCLFEGRRELFKGLAIEPEWNWAETYPVLKLDMGSCQAAYVSDLWTKINTMLESESRRLKTPLHGGDSSARFRFMIEDLAARRPDNKMVLLVDEYDKPLLGHLGKEDVNKVRDFLKAFYSVIKTNEGQQRFAFITGVSKFSKVSIFSDLNNLNDWTMDAQAATLFGYTHEEVEKYFPGRIHALAEASSLSDDATFAEIVKWYDGYKFHHAAEPVINPVSLGQCFQKKEFNDYWSKTAMPTFLVDILKKRPLDFSSVNIDERDLETYEPGNPKFVTLLYQTGYLTIKDFVQLGNIRRYSLRFPNLEIEHSFLDNVVGAYVGKDVDVSSGYTFAAAEALYAHDVPKFVKALKAFFANIPYSLTDRQNEQMWQTIVYVVLRLIGVSAQGEVRTNDGRIDLVAKTPGDIYIVEFKLDRPASEAMEQIKGKDYAGKYALSGKRITLVGISFSAEKRTIVEELVEELPS